MMDLDDRLDRVVENFVGAFNEMCRSKRKDFLVRQKMVNYESGSRLVSYRVTYKMKSTSREWRIFAATSGFWIFRSTFPLLRILKKEHSLSFSGLFTEDLKSISRSPEQLKEQLDHYLQICESLPRDAFINS
ncbi:hypothetical protein [Flavilitoribacter nigricans]|uniref:Uncharacterized protein n=1 Tax=Flavilitoribacter nigricans (strain ATCC 23147 / DSM 23189 / NBRC 102662 / NCIMB 1420 / SS-2) TaxID=1122177 RepID=A0A2D0NGJ0_FLAN2|nr:hypothetical protein [Flavilitoribacter nigricans]PHN07289.1 hypothetical protein CRP01_06570 [Flavilitoribacter nigricans DSM 23189 = NBRC 102662]